MSTKLSSRFMSAQQVARSTAEVRHEYRLFDEQFPAAEQLPRQFRVDFQEVTRDGKLHVLVFVNGNRVGDELTDNSYFDDGYRFHDVFHFGLAAMLGWSPMTRKLFGCKRRSVPMVDEVEDGGRARVLEEVVCALVYDYARQRDYLSGAKSIEPKLIDTIRSLISDREVTARRASDWEGAILKMYEAWRKIWKSGGGGLIADLEKRRLDCVTEAIA